MTATVALPAPATTNGNGYTRRPVRIEVDRHEVVGQLMDLQALAAAALDANGYSLQTVLRLPAGPWRQELQTAHHDTHERLSALLAELRLAAGRFDGLADPATAARVA